MILMIENYRSGLIWNVMNRIPEVKQAFRQAGFRPGTMPLPWPDPPEMLAVQIDDPVQIDGNGADWQKITGLKRYRLDIVESGFVTDKDDVDAEVGFAWDADYLYVFADVRDDSLVLRNQNDRIWRDDLLELFIDPQNNGLQWGSESDFQLGFRPVPESTKVLQWSWFKSKGQNLNHIHSAGWVREDGYSIEAAVSWKFLGVTPASGLKIGLSPVVNDVDRDRTHAKITTFFRNEDQPGKFRLSVLELK